MPYATDGQVPGYTRGLMSPICLKKCKLNRKVVWLLRVLSLMICQWLESLYSAVIIVWRWISHRHHHRLSVVARDPGCSAWIQDVGGGGRSTLDGTPPGRVYLQDFLPTVAWVTALDPIHWSLTASSSSPINWRSQPDRCQIVRSIEKSEEMLQSRR